MTLRFSPEGEISGGIDGTALAPERGVRVHGTLQNERADSRGAVFSIFCPDHIANTVARLEAEGDGENVGAYLRYVQMVRSAHHVTSASAQAG